MGDVNPDELRERLDDAEARIATLEAQLAAQRKIVAADDAALAEWKYPKGDLAAWRGKLPILRQACLEARKAAEQLDKESEDAT